MIAQSRCEDVYHVRGDEERDLHFFFVSREARGVWIVSARQFWDLSGARSSNRAWISRDMEGQTRKVVTATLLKTPVRTSVHAKRQRVDPTDLLDDDWMERPVPVSGPPVPICCAFRTCKKHKQVASNVVLARKVDTE